MDIIDPIPISYTEWLNVGMVLCSGTQGDKKVGLKLWKQWSAQDPDKYKNARCAQRWKGFKNHFTSDGVGIATLCLLAQNQNRGKFADLQNLLNEFDGGKTKKAEQITKSQYMKKLKIHYDELLARYVFVENQRMRYYDLKQGILVSPAVINEKSIYITNKINSIRASQDCDTKKWPLAIKPSDVLMNSGEKKTVCDLGWQPVPLGETPDKILKNHRGSSVLNTYYQPTMEPLPVGNKQCPLMKNRFLYLLECLIPEEDERLIFLQFLAHMLKHPEQKPKWNVILYGDHGSGKDTILSPMMRILGADKAKYVSPNSFFSDFNGEIEGLLLANIQEPKDKKEKKGFMTGLKRMTGGNSSGMMEVHAKGENKRYVFDALRVVIQVNTLDAIEIAQGDRRNFIIGVNPAANVIKMVDEKFGYTEKFGFFKDWDTQWKNGDMGPAVMTYLLHHVKLDGFVWGHLPSPFKVVTL